MRALDERDPLKELLSVQKRMNKLFETALERTDFEAQHEVDTWTPLADVFEADGAWIICLELPGLEAERIDLRVDGEVLVVSGERGLEREREGERFHRVERSYGKFSRRFHLPSSIDREHVDAVYRDGVLRIELRQRAGASGGAIQVAIR